jgi:hypothetical protein
LISNVERRQAFNLVAEEIEPDRVVALRRPHVDDAAAHGELGAVLDQTLAPVTRGGELADEVVAIEFGAATHDQWLAQRFGGQHLGDRAGRRHHDARATRLAQLPAQQRARGHHRAVGADALEGVGVPTGPQDHRGVVVHQRGQRVAQLLGFG